MPGDGRNWRHGSGDGRGCGWGREHRDKGWWGGHQASKRWEPKSSEEWGEWRDGAGETSWCEGKALITRGGGDELDAVKTEMATLRDDMKVLVLGFEKRIKMLEDNLHSAKARIEWLEAVNKKGYADK